MAENTKIEFPVDEAEMTALVNELASKLAKAAEKESASLVKAEAGERLAAVAPTKAGPGKDRLGPVAPTTAKKEFSEESSMSKDESAAEGSSPEGSSAHAGGPPSAGPAPSPSADPSAGAPPSPSADPAAAGAAPGADAPPSPEELTQMYMQLPPEVLQAHLMAAEQAAQAMGVQPGGSPPMGAGSPPPSAPPSPSPAGPPAAGPSPDMMAMKSELDVLKTQLKKAVEDAKTYKDDAEKSTKTVANILEKFVGAPMQKAATGITIHKYVPPAAVEKPLKKSFKEMSKGEIVARLTEVTQTKLTKAQRDLINEYFFSPGTVTLDQLEEKLGQ